MTEGCICWVVALLPEAKPLIERLKMKLVSTNSLHPIYTNETETDWLVLSGVGQLNAASGTASLYQVCPKSNWSIWVNIGIAGGVIGDVGDLFYINSICQASTNKMCYPFIFPYVKIKRANLITCESPEKKYDKDCLFDMEAWSFYKILKKKVTREFIAVFKVISDNSKEGMENLTKSEIFSLMDNNLDFIEDFRMAGQALSEKEYHRKCYPEIFSQLVAKYHFTFSQTQQLKHLVKRWSVIFPSRCLKSELQEYKTAKSILNFIKSNLDDFEVDWS